MDQHISESEDTDREYWEHPCNFALVKSDSLLVDVYSILKLEPKLMYTIIEDVNDARKLSAKMIEHGVRVFDNMTEFLAWYANRKK